MSGFSELPTGEQLELLHSRLKRLEYDTRQIGYAAGAAAVFSGAIAAKLYEWPSWVIWVIFVAAFAYILLTKSRDET